jgi:hypothetical protein
MLAMLGQLLAIFGLGTVVMRSAGCTVNDLWDRDVDKHVQRTKSRPITSGEISVQSGESAVPSHPQPHTHARGSPAIVVGPGRQVWSSWGRSC